ncbi:hypothetical protein TNIN_177051 [Trichonephila inaurata madagascariensis]|uniref:Uncharacterized protein n=1 Tax=Trichonephila inaurata madagascariensis TaxID=2747483 RepID=A0A8X6WQV0_9ARAC|nr:hypothetical protein TNIN_177051 [Trichonephila inaurata madagascariensis]
MKRFVSNEWPQLQGWWSILCRMRSPFEKRFQLLPYWVLLKKNDGPCKTQKKKQMKKIQKKMVGGGALLVVRNPAHARIKTSPDENAINLELRKSVCVFWLIPLRELKSLTGTVNISHIT